MDMDDWFFSSAPIKVAYNDRKLENDAIIVYGKCLTIVSLVKNNK